MKIYTTWDRQYKKQYTHGGDIRRCVDISKARGCRASPYVKCAWQQGTCKQNQKWTQGLVAQIRVAGETGRLPIVPYGTLYTSIGHIVDPEQASATAQLLASLPVHKQALMFLLFYTIDRGCRHATSRTLHGLSAHEMKLVASLADDQTTSWKQKIETVDTIGRTKCARANKRVKPSSSTGVYAWPSVKSKLFSVVLGSLAGLGAATEEADRNSAYTARSMLGQARPALSTLTGAFDESTIGNVRSGSFAQDIVSTTSDVSTILMWESWYEGIEAWFWWIPGVLELLQNREPVGQHILEFGTRRRDLEHAVVRLTFEHRLYRMNRTTDDFLDNVRNLIVARAPFDAVTGVHLTARDAFKRVSEELRTIVGPEIADQVCSSGMPIEDLYTTVYTNTRDKYLVQTTLAANMIELEERLKANDLSKAEHKQLRIRLQKVEADMNYQRGLSDGYQHVLNNNVTAPSTALGILALGSVALVALAGTQQGWFSSRGKKQTTTTDQNRITHDLSPPPAYDSKSSTLPGSGPRWMNH